MRLSKLLLAASAAVLFAACQPATDTNHLDTAGAKLATTTVPHAQLPDTVTPKSYQIDLKIDPQQDGMSGTVAIDVKINEAADRLWIHAKEMTVSSARIDYTDGTSIDLDFHAVSATEAPSGIAYLTADGTISAGEGVITLDYETPYNQNLNSAYKVQRGEEAYIVTQFEPLGAREAFPSFDEPKFKVPFTLSITSPLDETVISNTPKTGTTDVEIDGKSWVKHQFAQTRPLPTYLIAFAVGPYDVVDFGEIPPNSVRKPPLKLRGLTAKGKGERVQYALEGTEAILTALEEYFGSPYPYEKLDLIAAVRLFTVNFSYCWMRTHRCVKNVRIMVCILMNLPINGSGIWSRLSGGKIFGSMKLSRPGWVIRELRWLILMEIMIAIR